MTIARVGSGGRVEATSLEGDVRETSPLGRPSMQLKPCVVPVVWALSRREGERDGEGIETGEEGAGCRAVFVQ